MREQGRQFSIVPVQVVKAHCWQLEALRLAIVCRLFNAWDRVSGHQSRTVISGHGLLQAYSNIYVQRPRRQRAYRKRVRS